MMKHRKDKRGRPIVIKDKPDGSPLAIPKDAKGNLKPQADTGWSLPGDDGESLPVGIDLRAAITPGIRRWIEQPQEDGATRMIPTKHPEKDSKGDTMYNAVRRGLYLQKIDEIIKKGEADGPWQACLLLAADELENEGENPSGLAAPVERRARQIYMIWQRATKPPTVR